MLQTDEQETNDRPFFIPLLHFRLDAWSGDDGDQGASDDVAA